MNNNQTNEEKFWLAVRAAAMALFEAVPEELRETPPQTTRWLRLRDAAVMAWSALPIEYRATATEQADQQ